MHNRRPSILFYNYRKNSETVYLVYGAVQKTGIPDFMNARQLSTGFVAALILVAGVTAMLTGAAASPTKSRMANPTDDVTPPAKFQEADNNTTPVNVSNVKFQRLILDNVTVNYARAGMLTDLGQNGSSTTYGNLTASRMFVLDATLTNVTFEGLTIRNERVAQALFGNGSVGEQQNISIENATLSNVTLNGVVLEATRIQSAETPSLRIQGSSEVVAPAQPRRSPAIQAEMMTVQNATVARLELAGISIGEGLNMTTAVNQTTTES